MCAKNVGHSVLSSLKAFLCMLLFLLTHFLVEVVVKCFRKVSFKREALLFSKDFDRKKILKKQLNTKMNQLKEETWCLYICLKMFSVTGRIVSKVHSYRKRVAACRHLTFFFNFSSWLMFCLSMKFHRKKITEKLRNVKVEDVFLSRRHLSGFKVLSFLKHSHNKKEN